MFSGQSQPDPTTALAQTTTTATVIGPVGTNSTTTLGNAPQFTQQNLELINQNILLGVQAINNLTKILKNL